MQVRTWECGLLQQNKSAANKAGLQVVLHISKAHKSAYHKHVSWTCGISQTWQACTCSISQTCKLDMRYITNMAGMHMQHNTYMAGMDMQHITNMAGMSAAGGVPGLQKQAQ